MPGARVEIVMGVCDGAAHLPAQLESLSAQTHTDWSLLASDDSKGAQSAELIEAFAGRVPQKVQLVRGPQQGFAANYLHLLRKARPGHVALADQDDVWLPQKLSRALGLLPDDRPALYCARSFYWDGRARRRPSPRNLRPPGFRNALIENVAPGNTIVLNPAAADLARAAAGRITTVFAHDWLLYLLISGAGGAVIVDNGPPVLLYRQHEANQIGSGQGALAQIRRKSAVLAGAFKTRLTSNIDALQACRDFLTEENKSILDRFDAMRAQNLPGRMAALKGLGLYRQGALASVGFWGAALIGRV